MKRMLVLCFAMLGILYSCKTFPPGAKSGRGPAPSKGVLAINNALPEGNIELLDDFEEENFWYARGAVESDDFSIRTEIYCDRDAGNNYGEWTFANIPERFKAGFSCSVLKTRGWEGARYLICDIENVGQSAFSIYVELQAGEAHESTLTKPCVIGVGENTNVMFDLVHELTLPDGAPAAAITDSSDIREVTFNVAGRARAGTIRIDNIALVR